MTDIEGLGDDSGFACPWCGKHNDVWEFIGETRDGDTIPCGHCERMIRLSNIDYSVSYDVEKAPTGEVGSGATGEP